ncbi:MAG TPA: hydroxymethylbilane synthase [Terriglobia bacterium]|nr:hydroxymethylbilane synthase [Terriglobia bacterium]
MKIVVGSRGSKLALWQAGWVRDRLAEAGHHADIRIIKTTGDKLPKVSLTSSGTKGLFIKEIEEALAAQSIDLAVHSLKDLPTEQPPGLAVGAVPLRADARDALVSRSGEPLRELPMDARVGTSSLRRQSQLRALGPKLEVIAVRGNVDTRLKKLERGDCEALVLAAAGLDRLGLGNRITQYFAVEEMCPAVGQGALALEVREDDQRVQQAIQPLDDPATHQAVRAERALLRALGGGCDVPIAAHAWTADGGLKLVAVIASLDGSRLIRTSVAGPVDVLDDLGERAAQELLKQGAHEILAAAHLEVPKVE